ncbi:CBS domain-containing protein [Sphaerisporangium rhizosphaerae]|uniref:CBS domain-containing protein n=1 Tax=Sphaerisporangium rhizosphaerae TaxID=2269375 RepID=A0ABW2PJY4_9ACTN
MVVNVGDVMGRVAIAVRPDTCFADLVETMRRFKVGAVAVVDSGRRPVGVVSADDLLLREIGAERVEAVIEGRGPGRGNTKVAGDKGGTAAQVMSSPAITVTEVTPVREAARLMHEHRIRQLPVVDRVTGKIVGTVHQADLLKIFVRPPAEVLDDVEEAVRGAGVEPRTLSILVEHGLVALTGTVPRRSQIPLVVESVHAVDGVIEVDDRLGFATDDLITVPPLYL